MSNQLSDKQILQIAMDADMMASPHLSLMIAGDPTLGDFRIAVLRICRAVLAAAEPQDEEVFWDNTNCKWVRPNLVQPQQAEPDDDQAWDRNAERLTQEVFGPGKGINPNATSVDDLFLDDDEPAQPQQATTQAEPVAWMRESGELSRTPDAFYCIPLVDGRNAQPQQVIVGSPIGTEARVCEDIRRRQVLGISKYGTTVEDNPLPLRDWLNHAYEEALDLAIYLKRAMEELDKKT